MLSARRAASNWPLYHDLAPATPRASVDASGAVVELVTTLEGLQRLEPEYKRLHIATKNRIPFALHEWHVAWWRHFATQSGRVRDSLMVYVVRDRANRCVAIAPFVATERGFGPFQLRTMSMLGPDPYISELRGPLVEPEHEAMVARALRERLASDRRWHWIHWSGLTPRFAEELGEGSPVEWNEPTLDYVLDLPPTWELFRAGLKRNIKESLRHCYNSLKRDGLVLDVTVARTPAEVAGAVEQFLVLHAMRAGLTDTVRHGDRFERPKTRGFLRDICQRLAARDVVRVFVGKIEGKVVSARIGFVVGDSLYLYFSGYDPSWRKYSVMTTTVAEAIRYAIGQGLSTVSLSAGTDVSKTRWGARPVALAEGFECRPSLRVNMARELRRRALGPAEDVGGTLGAVLRLFPKRPW